MTAFAHFPTDGEIAEHFWSTLLEPRDGPHHAGEYHGYEGISLYDSPEGYCYVWVESVVDRDFYVSFLLDVRSKVGDEDEVRDFLFLETGGHKFRYERHGRPVRTGDSSEVHLARLSDGLHWFVDRVVQCAGEDF